MKAMKGLPIPQAVKSGHIECPVGGCFDMSYPSSRLRRGRVQEGGAVSPTLTCGGLICVYEGYEDGRDGMSEQQGGREAAEP